MHVSFINHSLIQAIPKTAVCRHIFTQWLHLKYWEPGRKKANTKCSRRKNKKKKTLKRAWSHQVKTVIAVIICCERWLINHRDFFITHYCSCLFRPRLLSPSSFGLSDNALCCSPPFVWHLFLYFSFFFSSPCSFFLHVTVFICGERCRHAVVANEEVAFLSLYSVLFVN